MLKKIFFIINPASGKSEEILNTIHEVLSQKDIKWDIGILQASSITDLFDRALQFNADAIGVYGGDGTVSAVAMEVHKTKLPLLVLPGGTANLFTRVLGNPVKLEECLKLLFQDEPKTAEIDLGIINDHHFLLYSSIGLTEKIMEETSDETKSHFGMMAYIASGLRNLLKNKKITLEIEIDGSKIKTEAYTCIICNSGLISMGKIELPSVEANDGMLDMFLVKELNFQSLSEVISPAELDSDKAILHTRGKKIKLKSAAPHSVQYDGEILQADEYVFEIIPKAINFIIAPDNQPRGIKQAGH